MRSARLRRKLSQLDHFDYNVPVVINLSSQNSSQSLNYSFFFLSLRTSLFQNWLKVKDSQEIQEISILRQCFSLSLSLYFQMFFCTDRRRLSTGTISLYIHISINRIHVRRRRMEKEKWKRVCVRSSRRNYVIDSVDNNR